MVAQEFSGIDAQTVEQWIELTLPLVSKKRFGKVYDQAVALLTAHRMKLAGVNDGTGDGAFGDIGSFGDALRVASYSEGSTSISFSTNQSSSLAEDADLTMTIYGTQYLSLRRYRIMPIISAGEYHGGS